MVGVVLAAGAGTRLAPLTQLRAKALCPVDNRPLVDWAISRVSAHCRNVAVNIHHHKQQLLTHLEGRGLHLSVEAPVALGTAGALGQLRGWIAGRRVLLTNADAWELAGTSNMSALINGWDGERPRLLCAAQPSPRGFGDLSYLGTALLPWWSVAELKAEPAGLYEVSWHRLQAQGRLEFVIAPDTIPIDCGTPEDYLRANLTASGGRSVVAPDAVVEGELVRSVVWPRSRVRADERLTDSIRAESVTVRTSQPTAEG